MWERAYAWNVGLRLMIKNAQIVTILRNDSYVDLKTEKLLTLMMVLRYMTLTTSSTFPQFHSKMTLLVKKDRKQQ